MPGVRFQNITLWECQSCRGKHKKYLMLVGLFSTFVAFAQPRENVGQRGVTDAPQISIEIKPALDSITGDELLGHIKVLASDEYEGREPGTRGENLTVSYLIEQFKRPT